MPTIFKLLAIFLLVHSYNVRFVLLLLQYQNLVLVVLPLLFIVIGHCSLSLKMYNFVTT